MHKNTYLAWLASVFAPELMLLLSIMLMSPGTATHLQHSEQGQIAHSNIPSTDIIHKGLPFLYYYLELSHRPTYIYLYF